MAVRKKTKKSAPDPVDEVKAEVREAALPSGPDSPAEGETHGESDFTLKYDMNSNQRYVDSTAQKSEFDRVLD